jgi:phage-related minor tail protein
VPDNQVGLEAVFENEEFQHGVNDYNSAVSDASQHTEEAGSAMDQVWDQLNSVAAAALGAVTQAALAHSLRS